MTDLSGFALIGHFCCCKVVLNKITHYIDNYVYIGI